MDRRSELRAGISVVLLLGATDVAALRLSWSDPCLVFRADAVVVGKVVSIDSEPMIRTPDRALHRFTLQLSRALKWTPSEKASRIVELTFNPKDVHDPRPELGKDYVAFVQFFSNGPLVMNGAQGLQSVGKMQPSRIDELRALVVEHARGSAFRPDGCPEVAW